MIHAVAIKAAAGVLVAGGAVVGVGTTGHCPSGETHTVFGCAKVTTAPDESTGTGTISAVTVNVSFRDEGGNKTGSGISTEDQFQWLGQKKPGKNGDGTLIKVKQITHGKGGWGPLYEGWIPVKFTQAPALFG